jgi:hypothetical protein
MAVLLLAYLLAGLIRMVVSTVYHLITGYASPA